jgi:hypothetical protein
MKLKDVNYYEYDHKRVCKVFEGELSYLGYICYQDRALAAYRNKKPNLQKGHKEVLLLLEGMDWEVESMKCWVSGMSLKDFKKHCKHDAIGCLECEEILYSLNRHHFHRCSCGNVSVDGGKDYFRFDAKDPQKVILGVYNVLSGMFTQAKTAVGKLRTKFNQKKQSLKPSKELLKALKEKRKK